MGGNGSGTWVRCNTKYTVEQSLTLAMHDFRNRIYPNSSGTFTWTWASNNRSSIGYSVTWNDGLTITLHYRWRDREDVQTNIQLQSTPTHFGGERLWFSCPSIVNGVACGRRVSKLHLPPEAKHFGCRECHDLTYRSCQEAHQEERLFGRIERMEQYMETLTKRGA